MTVARVVDASAVAAILFEEPEREVILARLRGVRLFAPALLYFEVGNICVTKIRRRPEARDLMISALTRLARMDIESVDVDHIEVATLAARSGLTAYDASYLWLARALGAELVTLDKQLIAAI